MGKCNMIGIVIVIVFILVLVGFLLSPFLLNHESCKEEEE